MEKTPLISIDIASDEDDLIGGGGCPGGGAALPSDVDYVVNFPGGKRHSTGDASIEAAAFISRLSQQSGQQQQHSCVSLYDAGGPQPRRSRSGSRTAVTDF